MRDWIWIVCAVPAGLASILMLVWLLSMAWHGGKFFIMRSQLRRHFSGKAKEQFDGSDQEQDPLS